MQKKILVVGGAGFIGSHMVKYLLEEGHAVVTLDNLSSGYRDAVLGGEFVYGSLADVSLLDRLFQQHAFNAVMHFASSIQVGESMKKPAEYYQNNVVNTLNLLNAMVRHQINCFIFSSSAAVYGYPKANLIDESHPKNPISPYGLSKWMIEQILVDFERAYGLKAISLRYFNAAGADASGQLGERHLPETHLIPLALQVASGRLASLNIFGDDYDTPDGTCIRDYIHVTDLCRGHLLALYQLWQGVGTNVFNLGIGQGFSVKEVIQAVTKLTQKEIPIVIGGRRLGDPSCLIANAVKAKNILNWKPIFTTLESIIQPAWQWEKSYIATCSA